MICYYYSPFKNSLTDFKLTSVGHFLDTTIDQSRARAKFVEDTSLYKPDDTRIFNVEFTPSNTVRMQGIGFNTFIRLSTEIRRVLPELRPAMANLNTAVRKGEIFEQWQVRMFVEMRNLLLSIGIDSIIYKNQDEGYGDSYIAMDSSTIRVIHQL